MKLKLFAALGLFVCAVSTQAANVSINDITILPGTPTVQVPILISPTDPAEMIGAMNISFAAGQLADAIPFVPTGNEFDNSLWDNAGNFFGVSAGTVDHDNNPATPEIPSVHSDFAAVAMLNPLLIRPEGTVITYTLDTSSLAAGFYDLDPNHLQLTGTADTVLAFSPGVLAVIPEPSTVALTAILGAMGLGLFLKRRRG